MVWTIGSLALLAAALGSRCAGALELSLRQERRLQARYIALAGVQNCIRVLDMDITPSYDGLTDAWAHSEELFKENAVGNGSFTVEGYGLQDEERKISLETAPPEVLDGLLAATGALEADREVIVDSILDWRDKDQEKRPYGAENFHYQGLHPAYDCKDGPFESAEELLFVRGMTPELFSAISPYVTAHGSGRVNVNTAGPEVLRALGFTEQGIQGLRIYCVGEDGKAGTPDDRALASIGAAAAELSQYIPVEDLNRIAVLDAAGALGVKSQEFAFDITARVADDEEGKDRVRIQGVIDREGRVKAWSER
ncbi:MAG: general secretion pathway protein GspK [Candidatus Omnitrophica bacterium]|nr:general secretion pathway protein GspK [Candidatus Omnitrophota bacterium]